MMVKVVIHLFFVIYMTICQVQGDFSAMNCKNTRKGLEYRGTTSVTRSGRTCQRWDSQYPHYHAFYILPSSNENFCRNPDSDSRPWCYTTDPQKRWEYCDVPVCVKNCKWDTQGLQYRGKTNVTKSGRKCQRWDSQYPHGHSDTDRLPGNASLNENFCRNPDRDSSPWCYTTDPLKRWEYCDVPVCDCGQHPNESLIKSRRRRDTAGGTPIFLRIVSGNFATKGMFPWQVGIRKIHNKTNTTPHCGGTILSSFWILSAAHCFEKYGKSQLLIRVGVWNNKVPDLYEEEFETEEIYNHTTEALRLNGRFVMFYLWHLRKNDTSNNDIALLKVKPNKRGRGISMGSYVQHACLPSEDTVYSENLDCYISGWGSLKNGISPHLLKYAQIPIANQTICKELYKLKGYNITESMFCAGYFNGGSDTCDGDSGGPLVCKVNGKYTVLGVTSWGHRCGLPNFPEVYGNVKSLLQWIRETHAAYYSLNLRTFSNPVCYICTVTSVDY
ncbi:plasminogen-like [Saccostrea cucullata]|uniref:plasminogen-like n=1 Tax=Saccostrea cuccullata TaxID=36930 RepID=UPI002ED302C7